MTTEEFEDIITVMWPDVKRQLAEKGYAAKLSYDNAQQQRTADLARMGVQPGEKVDLPPYSPDMHKVIEHTFHRLKKAVYNYLYTLGREATSEDVQEAVRICFMLEAEAETIKKDSDSLIDTYRCIAAGKDEEWEDRHGNRHLGSGGNWPPAKYR